MSLGRKQSISNDAWLETVATIETAVSREELDNLTASTIEDIKAKVGDLGLIILGRHRTDGNFAGRGTSIYTDIKGVTRSSTLPSWSHEHVLAYVHYHQLPLPPICGWKNGAHPWPTHQWTSSIENGGTRYTTSTPPSSPPPQRSWTAPGPSLTGR